jgi:hypothetical protein
MTDDEAKQFRMQMLDVAFPQLGAWFETLPHKIATWKVWVQCLRPYTLTECLSVLSRWSDGTLQPFEAYERERVHLLIRAIVERDRSRAKAKGENEATCKPVIAVAGSLVSPVLAKAVDMAKKGFSTESIQQLIDDEFPTLTEDETRHQCHACLDRKYVEIWSPAEVQRFIQQVKPEPTCTSVIDCSCTDKYHKYDPAKHCRLLGYETLSERRQKLVSWLQDRNRVEHHYNYNPEFSEHNQ